MKEYACQAAIGRRIERAAKRARQRAKNKKPSPAELVHRYKMAKLRESKKSL